MVILPAGPAPPKRESIPDRLRRYFTLPEIEAWSASIGPARLFVIPADKRAAVWEWGPLQPANNCRDTSQLSSATWILLGTITEPPVASQPRQRCLPLGSFQFRLRH